MDDMISRQAAIDQLHQSYNLLDAEQRLEDLSPVQPERKKGKWIRPKKVPDSALRECSICGFDTGAKSFNFCPNCGCNMKGEQNG